MNDGHLLAGLRVLDHTDLRGALCARVLADLGADVRRIRHTDDNGGAADRFRNARKQIVPRPQGTDHIEWLGRADVYIENHGPGGGLDREAILTEHPRLVHVSLSDFGLSGPRSHWHLEALPALASSGALHTTGFPHLPPTALPGYTAHDCGSVHGALGAVAAILDRERTGLGQRVEVSVQEAALAGLVPWSMTIPDYLRINPLLPVEGTRAAEGRYLVFPAADGHVRVVIGTGRDWDNLVRLLGRPEELSGPEWKNLAYRWDHTALIREIGDRVLARRERHDIYAEAMDIGLPAGVVQTPLEFVAHPQNEHREFFHNGVAVAPWKLSGTPAGPPTPPEPASSSDPWPARESPSPDPKGQGEGLLLSGVRVVEFGIAAVVPEMCWMLSELGADIIRIESITKMDTLRFSGLGEINKGFSFNCESRGRRSVALDLTTEDGRRLARELCATADVVAENNRGGMMAKLGLDYNHITAINPDVIYAASQGYGRGGPMGEMKAYGPLNSCFSGVHVLFSHPDGPYPSGTSMNHPDHIAGKLMAVAVLAALDHRHRTGEGQLIDMAQTEAAVYLLGDIYLDAIESGEEPVNGANRHPEMVPHGVYPASGHDEWITIAVADDEQWRSVESVCGWPHDPALASLEGRLAAHGEIDSRLAEWTVAHDPDEASASLQAAGVSALTVMGPLRHLSDTHLASRDHLDELIHPEVGIEHHVRNPTLMTRTELRTATSAPCLGAHTSEVLTDVLGLSSAEIAGLEAAGVLR